MTGKRLLAVLTGALMLTSVLPVPTGAAEPKLVDAGIDYTEDVRTVNNPGAGYTSTLWYVCKPGATEVKNPQGNLVLMFVDIGAFSSGANGKTNDDKTYTEGKDYDLDDAFFKGMRGTLENCRKNGCTVAVRFRYDANGKTNPEPATFEQVLHHIDQIKADGFLEDYKDILMYVESGFVGAWGEQHSGKYTSLEYKAKLLQAVLDMTPDDIPVTVRTPNIFAQWAGIKASELGTWESEPGMDAARVGLYNDGYMGSDSDLGTYADRENETAWLGRQTLRTYFGGEFSGNLEWAQKYDTYLPENAIPEMYKTHLSYINGNIYQLYKDYEYTKALDKTGYNTAYYGQNVFTFVRDHLGYRFVLQKSELSEKTAQGEAFDLHFSVLNTGFANPIRPQKAQLILEKKGQYIVTDIPDLDDREWRSCTVQDEALSVKLPGGIEPGTWNVYLRLSVGNQDVADGNLRCVEFANKDIWNASLGANRLGSILVQKSADLPKRGDQSFSVNGADTGNAILYQINGMPILDGERSGDAEWTENEQKAEKDGNLLYITNDDRYLYVAAEIRHGAAKPVINLRVTPAVPEGKKETTYWYYRQSAGWIYYSAGNHDGIQLKAKGDFMEFRIPFGEVMGLSADTLLKNVTIFIQDEADEWKGCGTVTAENYQIEPRIFMHTAPQSLWLNEGCTYTMRAVPASEGTTITWQHDGKALDTKGDMLTLRNVSAADKGVYTAVIESKTGAKVTQTVCKVGDVIEAPAARKGDLNLDGKTDAADAKLLTDWLHGRRVTVKGDADQNADGVWDVYDLALLKRALQ